MIWQLRNQKLDMPPGSTKPKFDQVHLRIPFLNPSALIQPAFSGLRWFQKRLKEAAGHLRIHGRKQMRDVYAINVTKTSKYNHNN